MERDALLKYLKELDQQKAHVLQYQFINQKIMHLSYVQSKKEYKYIKDLILTFELSVE